MSKENYIYGIRPLMEAIRSGQDIEKVLLQDGQHGELYREVFKMVREAGIPFQNVPVQKLNRITGKNHQGIIAFISPLPFGSIESILPGIYELGQAPFLLILDRITDVRNFGALARTAECAGIHAVMIPARGSAQINEDAIKTSAGALLRVPVCRSHNLKESIHYFQHSGIQVIAVSEKAQKLYSDIDLRLPTALILGSEEDGVSAEYIKLADAGVKIPMFGEIASLNVSVAGGIVMFEAVRQRTIK